VEWVCCSSDSRVCCSVCFFYCSYMAWYAYVRVFVNSASCVVFVAFSFSNAMKRSSIAGLLCSMQSLSSVISFLNLDISTLVVDAASLSVLMNFLFSPIPLCISAQYLPYAVNVCVFRSMALANSICWWCNLMQFPYIYCSNSFMVVLPLFSWSLRNYASLVNY